MINERGGVEGYKIRPIYADAQSKAEVAINEAERLLDQEKVDLIMGVYSSAHCVPMAQKVDAAKKFMWANVCTASSVFKDKNLQYVFRPQVHSDQFGAASCSFLNEQAKARLSKDPKDLKVAIIYEDGPYGAGVAAANEESVQEATACRSCSRKATPRPRPTCRRWSPSCAARAPTSSCTPATTPTSRCSGARRASRA